MPLLYMGGPNTVNDVKVCLVTFGSHDVMVLAIVHYIWVDPLPRDDEWRRGPIALATAHQEGLIQAHHSCVAYGRSYTTLPYR